ncbi:hypothetical protein DOY81_012032, partial [Sarcophaga bullata]
PINRTPQTMVKPTMVPQTISALEEKPPLVSHKIMQTMEITYEMKCKRK